MGTCEDLECRLCRVIVVEGARYRTAWQRGFCTVIVASKPKGDATTKREEALTRAQQKKAAATAAK